VKFGEFLKRDTGAQGTVVSSTTLSRLERELAGGARLSSLVQDREGLLDGLPTEHLRDVVESYRRYQRWRTEAARVGRRLESIEREVIGRTVRTHQLSLLERALRLAAQGRCEALDRPGVLSVCLELWESCRAEVRRRGRIRCNLTRPDHPLAASYGDHAARTDDLEALKPHRWLAMRRGEREGALALELDFSDVPLLTQATARRERLGNAVKDRTDESLLRELVLDDLPAAIFEDLDEWARAEALKFACDAYAGLLRSRPLKVERLCSLYIGAPDHPVGRAGLEGEGAVRDSQALDPAERGWLSEAVKWITTMGIQHLAVPSDTRSSKRLSEITEQLGAGVGLVQVRPNAMAESRKTLVGAEQDLPQAVANAVILGRRALAPLKAWGAIDPVHAGVGEYQGEIDEDELREALVTTRALVHIEGKKAPVAPQAVAIKPVSPLGPTVRKAAELRPGMSVTGQITNVTGFGAFVALGLEYEGMIHVSEMSDEFISNPNEVVKIGDKVTARVITVDPKRRRISLSLRTQTDRPPPRRSGGGAGGPQRHQALRELEQLFKKD
jgi:predicted RNA-binding protein with RPS1 domain